VLDPCAALTSRAIYAEEGRERRRQEASSYRRTLCGGEVKSVLKGLIHGARRSSAARMAGRQGTKASFVVKPDTLL